MIRIEEFNDCILCGSRGVLLYANLKDRAYYTGGTYNYYLCKDCKLAWLNPHPIKEDLPLCYKDYYTHPDDKQLDANRKGDGALVKKIKRLFKVKLFSGINTNKETCSFPIMPKWYGEGKLLDIGCGDGLFLFNMKKMGWQTYGIEIDEKAANYAITNYDLNIYIGCIEDSPFRDNFFDVITMNHVIEHIYDPLCLFEQCYKKLVPGGYVYIETPNLHSLAHRIFRKDCLFFDVPRHLWIWSKDSLMKAALNKKFKIVECRTTNYYAASCYDQSMLIKKVGKTNFNWAGSLAGKLFSKVEHIINIYMKDIGEDVYLVLRKVN